MINNTVDITLSSFEKFSGLEKVSGFSSRFYVINPNFPINVFNLDGSANYKCVGVAVHSRGNVFLYEPVIIECGVSMYGKSEKIATKRFEDEVLPTVFSERYYLLEPDKFSEFMDDNSYVRFVKHDNGHLYLKVVYSHDEKNTIDCLKLSPLKHIFNKMTLKGICVMNEHHDRVKSFNSAMEVIGSFARLLDFKNNIDYHRKAKESNINELRKATTKLKEFEAYEESLLEAEAEALNELNDRFGIEY